ncbi:hypothetical protein ES703_58344 [subsurface metagenome]
MVKQKRIRDNMLEEGELMVRIKITVTIDPEVIEKIDKLVKTQIYRNRSHAVEAALIMLLEKRT